MATDFQVAIDCGAPHDLADRWVEALGWQVEPSDKDVIRTMVAAGRASDADTTTHRGVLVWRGGQAITSPDPGRPRVLFQLVPESKTAKNRLHLDLRVGAQARESEVTRLVARGLASCTGPRRGRTSG